MKWFANLKIGAKLALGFGVCLLLAGGVGTTALSGFSAMMVNVDSLSNDSIAGLVLLVDIQAHSRQFRTVQYRLAGDRDPRAVLKITSKLLSEQALADKSIESYGKTITQPDDRANFDELKAA